MAKGSETGSQGGSRRRQALGRGLSALIPGSSTERDLLFCQIDAIKPPTDQPRTAINPEALRELADSIRQSGVLQPVLVRREADGLRLVAGERRWRAAKMAGLSRIPALVKELSQDVAYAAALVENIQREDLTPLEEALGFRRLIDEFGYTQQSLAELIGRGRSTIANTLRLLDLPTTVQGYVASGQLTPGHARAVLSVPSGERLGFAKELIDSGSTVRDAESKAKPIAERKTKAADNERKDRSAQLERKANIERLERLLCEALQTRVRIDDRGRKGTIQIFYDNDDILSGVTERLLESPF